MITANQALVGKVVLWRFVASLITLLGIWAFTSSLTVSLWATIVLVIVKTLVHYLFELAWEKITS